MSKYICLAGAVVILMAFLLQFPLQTANSVKMDRLETIVNAAKEEAKQAGYFTPEITADLKARIAAELDVEENEIIITATATPKYRTGSFDERELIEYEVGIPIEELVAAGAFWGVTDNQMVYYIRGVTASEALPL